MATAKKVGVATAEKKGSKEMVLEAIEGMTVLELAELIREMEQRFGVTAAAPVLQAGPGAPAAVEEAKPEEKTEFTVTLTGIGEKKIQVIKVIRELTSLGLKEAKDLVEGAPIVVKEGITKEEAEKMKAKLEEVGATVELK